MVNERIREYGKKSQRGRKEGGKQEGNTKLHEQRSSQPAERSRALWDLMHRMHETAQC